MTFKMCSEGDLYYLECRANKGAFNHIEVDKDILKMLIHTYRETHPEFEKRKVCSFCGGEHK